MENTPSPAVSTAPAPEPTLTQPVAPNPNLPLAIVAGLVAALVGASLWAGLTLLTERQFGYAAIGLGFLVGFAVRFVGHGTSPAFRIVGGVLSLVGCALGNLLSTVGFISKESEVSFFSMLGDLDLDVAIEMMKFTFEPMDLLFYGLAAYCGFKFSVASND